MSWCNICWLLLTLVGLFTSHPMVKDVSIRVFYLFSFTTIKYVPIVSSPVDYCGNRENKKRALDCHQRSSEYKLLTTKRKGSRVWSPSSSYNLSSYFCFWWFGLVLVSIPRWLFYLHEASSVNCKTALEAMMIVVRLVVPWLSPPLAIEPSMAVPMMVWLLLLWWWSVVPQSDSLLNSQVLSLDWLTTST